MVLLLLNEQQVADRGATDLIKHLHIWRLRSQQKSSEEAQLKLILGIPGRVLCAHSIGKLPVIHFYNKHIYVME